LSSDTSPAGRVYVVMPRYIDTLEATRRRSSTTPRASFRGGNTRPSALTHLHGLGFARWRREARELGRSMEAAPFPHRSRQCRALAQRQQTTTEYLPVDERGVRVVASARADWWALAMTLAEKACGAAGFPLGHGARVWTASDVRAHLEAHLPAGVWAALAGHIAPR
jgi:hypothetical protein